MPLAVLLIVLVLAAGAVARVLPTTRPADWTVGTFNVRNSGAADGADAWPLRRDLLVRTVRAADPDVIGLQEVLIDQHEFLTHALSDYAAVAIFRDDGKTRGEACSLFYRKARFDLLDHGTFWLSQTPETPGSMGWDAACTRLCTWAKLHDKAAGRDVLVMNTHLDHVGQTARRNSVALMAERLAKLADGLPAVLLGDFNATEDGPVYAALLAAAKSAGTPLSDAYRAVHPTPSPDEASYHGFADTTRGLRIDWTFTTPGLTATAAAIDRAKGTDNRYPSDHYPVWCTLRYDAAASAVGKEATR